MPKIFWADALLHALLLFNSTPCNNPSDFHTPNSVSGLPDVEISYTHPFGCLGWFKVPEASRKKLDPKARLSVLLSYLPDGKGFRLWDLECRVVVKNRDVMFDHARFPYGSSLSPSTPPVICKLPIVSAPRRPDPVRTPTPYLPLLDYQLETCSDRRLQASIHKVCLTPSPTPSTPLSPPPPAPPCHSTRPTRKPDRYGTLACAAVIPDISNDQVPKTWKQVQLSPHRAHWLAAAEDEFKSLVGMETWKLVPQPLKRKIIKSKWVLRFKRRVYRSIMKLKARLLAMGYPQVKGEDFDEVFSPTIGFETLHLLFSLLASKGWAGQQLDF